MKIISWNMNQYGRWANPDLAWEYLICDVRPDIALLQEALVPERYSQDAFFLESYSDERLPRWGTAIYVNRKTVPSFDLGAVERKSKEVLRDMYSLGKTVVADITMPDSQTYTFASLHIDTGRYGKIPIVTDWPEVDHLKALFENGDLGRLKGNFVIGGDFNADPVVYSEHKSVFRWLDDHGFYECLKDQPNTYFGYKRKTKIQDDHFLVHESMANRIVSCSAIDYERIKHFSDHTIIEMELRI